MAEVLFDTKVAIVLREDLAVWQKTNAAAFLISGIAASGPNLVGEPYVDGSGNRYLPILRADGAHRRRLLDTAEGKFAYSDVKWSPDGRRIAFTRYTYATDTRGVFSVRYLRWGLLRRERR